MDLDGSKHCNYEEESIMINDELQNCNVKEDNTSLSPSTIGKVSDLNTNTLLEESLNNSAPFEVMEDSTLKFPFTDPIQENLTSVLPNENPNSFEINQLDKNLCDLELPQVKNLEDSLSPIKIPVKNIPEDISENSDFQENLDIKVIQSGSCTSGENELNDASCPVEPRYGNVLNPGLSIVDKCEISNNKENFVSKNISKFEDFITKSKSKFSHDSVINNEISNSEISSSDEADKPTLSVSLNLLKENFKISVDQETVNNIQGEKVLVESETNNENMNEIDILQESIPLTTEKNIAEIDIPYSCPNRVKEPSENSSNDIEICNTPMIISNLVEDSKNISEVMQDHDINEKKENDKQICLKANLAIDTTIAPEIEQDKTDCDEIMIVKETVLLPNAMKDSVNLSDVKQDENISKHNLIEESDQLNSNMEVEIKSEFLELKDNELNECVEDTKPEDTEKIKQESEPIREFLAENFDWDTYLEDTSSEAVPPTSFLHVEASLETGVRVGQHVEVLKKASDGDNVSSDANETDNHSWVSFWPAKVLSSCGNLLRLWYLTDELDVNSSSLEFWSDLNNLNIKPLGWSSSRGIPLESPLPFSLTASLDDLEGVPEDVFKFDKREIYARIQEGLLVEVFNQRDPYTCIVAEVQENKGGRLLLKEIVANGSEVEPFWLFFLDHLIKPFGWTKNQLQKYRYKDNAVELLSFQNHPEATLPKQDSHSRPISHHCLQKGMVLEVIHPFKLDRICSATISDVIDDTFFEVSIEDHSWITHIEDLRLLPCGFRASHNLEVLVDLKKENETCSDVIEDMERYKIGSDLLSSKILAKDLGFEEGHKLELFDPCNSSRMLAATVQRILDHMLMLTVDSDPALVYFQSCLSMDIYPVGWAESHSYPLYVPFFQNNLNTIKKESLLSSPTESPDCEMVDAKPEKTELPSDSMWCPKLFINHNCYPGPYLSKYKIAKIHQSVGPGPMRLVLSEVVSRTINAAYIPTRVLRELQNLESLNPAWESVLMKAKFKRYILKAGVKIPSSCRDVSEFFEEISKLLLCCPNLWSQEAVRDNCVYNCVKQNGGGSQSAKKKRGSKRKTYYSIKASASDAHYAELCDQFEGEEEFALSESEGDSRPASPSSAEGARKLKQKRLLSSLAITMNSSRPEKDKRKKEIETPASSPTGNKLVEEVYEENASAIFGLVPANIDSDPLDWSIDDVERYIVSQSAISHHAARFRDEEVDGKALLLLNLPSLIHHLQMPHRTAVVLAQHICKVKLAHFLYFHHSDWGNQIDKRQKV